MQSLSASMLEVSSCRELSNPLALTIHACTKVSLATFTEMKVSS